jgi:hypothetical protein
MDKVDGKLSNVKNSPCPIHKQLRNLKIKNLVSSINNMEQRYPSLKYDCGPSIVS